jgi:hypothetical protein
MRRLLIVSLILIPSLATAQRTKSAATSRTKMDESQPLPTGPSLKVRDIEDMNPIRLLIDKRKDLKLTDAQLAAFKASEPQVKDKAQPLLKTVDSLLHEMRPASNNADQERIRIGSVRRDLMSTMGDISTAYDAAAKEAVATLTPEQQTKANELLAKQHEDNQKTLMEKLGGGTPRGGGGDRPPR